MASSICPLLTVAAALSEATVDRREYAAEHHNYGICLHEACALWTRYGCGLSNNITVHAPKEATNAE